MNYHFKNEDGIIYTDIKEQTNSRYDTIRYTECGAIFLLQSKENTIYRNNNFNKESKNYNIY